MKTILFSTVAIIAIPIAGSFSPSNIDPPHKFGWGENIGWTNWQHDAPNAGDGVVVTPTYLAGMVWAENVGWINFGNGGGPYDNDPADSSTFGINIDFDSGDMFGKAWGENIGWINFDTRATQGPHNQQARLDFCDNRMRGYAWGENIGWINLDDAFHFIALGPECAAGDVACDGVIGLQDFSKFADAVSGPGVSADCSLFDADGDLDIDLIDFGAFQAAFNEP
jgi:hypothetical protein